MLDWPHGFGVAFAGVGFADLVAEFVFEGGEDGGEIGEACGGRFGLGIPAVCGHGAAVRRRREAVLFLGNNLQVTSVSIIRGKVLFT